ncbi:TPR end-of-group domain-containing protein [Idiomarina sp. HP20-50]|uniref:TPR end-of-group domain-containing protein n=1 Tax=Idiomarina sp. HP20-50 TaxID=3070813 RepID=UPI00294AD3F7|nr:hypothetical protein [Idiomarina sp. HP20-50]MDV6315155.1 hypothetical protein [Idiomarina sp. HP20-50]
MSTITNTSVNVTPETPTFLGHSNPLENDAQYSYFFNGCFIYSYNHTTGHCTCLTELDVATAAVKPYGLADKHYVVIGDKVYRSLEQAEKARNTVVVNEAANDNNLGKGMQLPAVEDFSTLKSLELIEKWFSKNFDEKWETYRETSEFYNLIQYYLALCCDAYKRQPDPSFLDAGIQLYLSMAHYSWINPSILHNAACVYWLADEEESALDCIELALNFRYSGMASLFNDEDLKPLRESPRFQRLLVQYETLKPKFNYITLELFEVFENFSVQQPESFIRFMRSHLLKNFRFYDISELSARLDTCEDDEEREYWQRLAALNNRYLYNYMLVDEPMELLTEEGKANYQRFQQYRHYRVLNPLVFAKVSEQLFHHAHYWASKHKGNFNQRDSALLSQSFQLFEEFNVSTESLCFEKKRELMEKAKEYDIFDYMEQLAKY